MIEELYFGKEARDKIIEGINDLNKAEKKYYVYSHRKENGDLFYIGMGSGKRAYKKDTRSSFWKKTFNKYGLIVNILFSELTKKEAYQIEEYLVRYYGRRNLNTGILVNLTNGGEGDCGYKPTIETLKLKSKILKGKKQSEESNIKRSITLISNRNISKKCKKVIDTETNIVYSSVIEVSEVFNISYSSLKKKLNGARYNDTKFLNYE